MKNAMVEKTPHVWNAWFICSWDGYVTAASIMIHQPVKNRTPETTEATAFLLSPQSMHSQSGQRKLSRKPAICSPLRVLLLFCLILLCTGELVLFLTPYVSTPASPAVLQRLQAALLLTEISDSVKVALLRARMLSVSIKKIVLVVVVVVVVVLPPSQQPLEHITVYHCSVALDTLTHTHTLSHSETLACLVFIL